MFFFSKYWLRVTHLIIVAFIESLSSCRSGQCQVKCACMSPERISVQIRTLVVETLYVIVRYNCMPHWDQQVIGYDQKQPEIIAKVEMTLSTA